MHRPDQPGASRRQPPGEPDDSPTLLDRGLDELELLALGIGDAVSAQRAARLRRLIATVAELRHEPPAAVPAQRTAPPPP